MPNQRATADFMILSLFIGGTQGASADDNTTTKPLL
jgi:hypothetical protein